MRPQLAPAAAPHLLPASEIIQRKPPAPEWISGETLKKCGISDRTIRHWIQNEKLQWRGSRGSREYSFESLSPQIQLEVLRSLAGSPAGSALESANGASAPPMNDKQKAEAEHNWKLLQEWEQLCERLPKKQAAELIGERKGEPQGIYTRLRRLRKRFKEHGYSGLGRKTREDHKHSRSIEGQPELARFIIAKVAEGLSMAEIDAAVRREKDMLGKPPSRNAIARFIENTVPKPLRTLPRSTEQQWKGANAPYLVTDHTQHLPNEIWVSDHRILDIFWQNDAFAALNGQFDLRAIRVWETVIQDLRSRAIVGYCFCLNPSSRSIASALRMAIARFGLPQTFYVDNGKDFRKIGKGALRTGFASGASELEKAPLETDNEGRVILAGEHFGLLRRLGIAAKYCTPRHPQAKQIESFFAFQSKRFDVIFGAAYGGRKPHLRSDANAAALKLHKDFLAGKAAHTALPLASEGIQMAAYWLEEFNTGYRDHQGIGMDGRTPYEVMNELLPEDKRRRVNVSDIAPLFWEQKERTVRNCKVEAYRATFEAADDTTAAQLFLRNGEQILLHCDPHDLGEAYVFDAGGRPIGPMRSQQLVARGPVSHDAVRQMQRMRSRVVRAAKEFNRLARHGVPSELDFLRARAGVIEAEQPAPPQLAVREPLQLVAAADDEPRYTEDEAASFRAEFGDNWREEN